MRRMRSQKGRRGHEAGGMRQDEASLRVRSTLCASRNRWLSTFANARGCVNRTRTKSPEQRGMRGGSDMWLKCRAVEGQKCYACNMMRRRCRWHERRREMACRPPVPRVRAAFARTRRAECAALPVNPHRAGAVCCCSLPARYRRHVCRSALSAPSHRPEEPNR